MRNQSLKERWNVIVIMITLSLIMNGLLAPVSVASSKYRFDLPVTDPLWGEGAMWALYFAKVVETMTGGDITISVYPGGEWGGAEEDYARDISLGALDMSIVASSVLASYTSALYMFDVPFLFRGIENQIGFLFDSPTEYNSVAMAALTQAGEDAGVVALAMAPVGRRDIFSRVPLESADDLVGLKVRTMSSEIQVEAFNLMGSFATPLPTGEVFTALQVGVVDAAENSPSVYVENRWCEPAPYWLGTNHYSYTAVLIMSKRAWDSLPEAYQSVLRRAAIRSSFTFAQWGVGMSEVYLRTVIPKLVKGQVYLSTEEYSKLRRKVLPSLLDRYGEQIGLEVLEALAVDDDVIREWLKY